MIIVDDAVIAPMCNSALALVGSPPGSEARAVAAGIRGIPVEILRCIFLRLRDNAVSGLNRNSHATMVSAYSWLSVTQVCRYWYEASTECPALWSVILIPPLDSLPFLELSLRRSKHSPLFVDFDHRNLDIASLVYNAHALLNAVLLERARIQDLRVDLPAAIRRPDLNDSLLHLGPHLRRLHFSAIGASWYDQGANAEILFPFNGMEISRLRELKYLAPNSLSWDRIRSLQMLEVLDVDFSFLSPVDLRALLECISGLPALQALRLVWLSLTSISEAILSTPKVAIHRLRKCDLTCGLKVCAIVLSHLQLPPTTSIRTAIAEYDVPPQETRVALVDYILRTISQPAAPTITVFALSWCIHFWNSFCAWDSQLPLRLDYGWSDGVVCRLTGPSPSRWGCDDVQPVTSLPLRCVQTLIVRGDRRNSSRLPVDWNQEQSAIARLWAPAMPNLRELRLSLGQSEHGVLHSSVVNLLCGPLLSTPQSPATAPWPSLETLVLYDLQHAGEQDVSAIGDILRRREQAGCRRLARLVLHQPTRRDELNLPCLRDTAEEIVTLFGEIHFDRLFTAPIHS